VFKTETELMSGMCPKFAHHCLGSKCNAFTINHAVSTSDGRRVLLADRATDDDVIVFAYCAEYPKPNEAEHDIKTFEE